MGYPSHYRHLGNDVVYCGFTIRFRLHDKIRVNPEFVTHQLQSLKTRNEVLKYSTVSANTNINQEAYSKVNIVMPDLEEQLFITNLLNNLDTIINTYRKEIVDFIEIKKALMGQLLTGKIRTM